MTSQHHVSELVAINGTKSRPESGPSRDHVGTKSGPSRDQVLFQPPAQLATQSPAQLHKISSPRIVIKSVTTQEGEQVTEQVPATNNREHRNFAAEVKSTSKVAARVTAKVTTYQGDSKT